MNSMTANDQKILASRCFYLPNIALNGGTYDEFTASDIKRCCIACAKDHCCLGYSYSKSRKRCYMKSAVSDSAVNYDTTSGLKANTHSGEPTSIVQIRKKCAAGAFLKNIVIEGGAAAAIRLRKPGECQQYCTVYGIYSWSPPTEEDEADDGHCACMTRIQSLEYSYGSQSAIFPPLSSLN
uniref:Apple domain-containing protein n=1 Tax=Ascaris lumbricoides TaxID=6252 RepID=A0A0M3HU83_ASCLU